MRAVLQARKNARCLQERRQLNMSIFCAGSCRSVAHRTTFRCIAIAKPSRAAGPSRSFCRASKHCFAPTVSDAVATQAEHYQM